MSASPAQTTRVLVKQVMSGKTASAELFKAYITERGDVITAKYDSVLSFGKCPVMCNCYHITRPLKGFRFGGKKERRPFMVITLDKNKKPLGWCSPKRANGLIKTGRAVVYRYFPFTIILKDKDVRKEEVHHSYRVK